MEPLLGLSLYQLRALAAVIDAGGFGRAAAVLGVSEATVSEHVRLLERAVGYRLVERSPGRAGVTPTEAGGLVLALWADTSLALERTATALSNLADAPGGSVALAVGPHFAAFVLPGLIDSFRRAYPGITMSVVVADNQQTKQQVRQRAVDFGVVTGFGATGDLMLTPLMEFDNVVVALPSHPLASVRHPVPLIELAAEPWIFGEPASELRRTLEQRAREAGTPLRIVLESMSVDARIQAVLSGVGIAAISAMSVSVLLIEGRLVTLPVAGLPLRMTWNLVRRPGQLSTAAERLFRYLQARQQDLVSTPGRVI